MNTCSPMSWFVPTVQATIRVVPAEIIVYPYIVSAFYMEDIESDKSTISEISDQI